MIVNKNGKIIIAGIESIRGIASCLIICFYVWALCELSGKSSILDGIVSNFDSFVRMFFY